MSNDLTGKQFGYWTVLQKDDSCNSKKHPKWICKCECGTIRPVFQQSLFNGRSKSCGCRAIYSRKGKNATHGMSKTRIYHEWLSMRRRCKQKNKSNKDYYDYYDRGITVCNEWDNSFESFYNWSMSNGYSDNLTIDRINNDLGYSPENCRWISIEEQ